MALGLVVVLGALSAFAPLSLDLYLPGLPQVGAELGASDAVTQLSITACLVGLAVGQLLAGPLSDRLGRRRPLLVGVAVFMVTSMLCAVAPSVEVLLALRVLQGLAGAAGIVISRAVVRDLREGEAAARLYSLLLMVNGAAPILAPVAGGQLLSVMSWRGLFVVLGGLGLVLLVMAVVLLPETLPPGRRSSASLRASAAVLGVVGRDAGFRAYAVAGGLVTAAMFVYIAASPFVLQQRYGLSPQLFSVVFALNGGGIVVASALNGVLLRRLSLVAVARGGVVVALAGSLVVLAAVLWPQLGLAALLVGFFVVVSTVGTVGPTTTALALADHGSAAGSAAGLLGALQFVGGAIAAPLAGLGGGSPVVMGGLMVLLTLAAAAVVASDRRRQAAGLVAA